MAFPGGTEANSSFTVTNTACQSQLLSVRQQARRIILDANAGKALGRRAATRLRRGKSPGAQEGLVSCYGKDKI